ncbi:MAG TPA: hypothetical protein VN626_08890 [Clostridia bacterium]|nr:hypothetical protein [Clostridia bacterium]
MKNLNAFLNPRRKENLKFILSDAFCDDNSQPIEWELRELSAQEMLEIQRLCEGRGMQETSLALAAESLVTPNIHDAELLAGLSKREGRTILNPVEALRVMLSGSELSMLLYRYFQQQSVGNFEQMVSEAKNSSGEAATV